MKIALATTTIHVPHALKLLRKCSPDVRFFVAGDLKSPHEQIFEALKSCHPACYIEPATTPYEAGADETQSIYKCSELIGWNTLARRNIAFLEALKWGADAVYSWDDDNLPIDLNHFDHIQCRFQSWPYAGGNPNFHGIKVSNAKYWFDPGSLLFPVIRHRGISWNNLYANRSESVVDAKIGIVAGLVLGDPDIDATTRIEKAPDIGHVHLLGHAGVVVDPFTWTVFNSQNTAVIRDLVPAWFMMPGVGRHDDIYASLIVQRVGRERGYHVHFGPPFTYQQRNQHNLIADLRAEIDGMENTVKLAGLLDAIPLAGRNTIDDTRKIYETLLNCTFLPRASVEAGLAWLDDCELAMGG